MPKLDGIHKPTTLSASDWTAVDELVVLSRTRDGLEVPLHRQASRNADEPNQLVFYKRDLLLGIATLPSGTDVEVLGVVHPDHRRKGIGGSLIEAVNKACVERGVTDYLLVVEEASLRGCAFAENAGGRHEFSEHLMEMKVQDSDARESGDIEVRLAEIGDLESLLRIREETDNGKAALLEHWLKSDVHQIFVARRGGTDVGMIRVTEADDAVWLTSFEVHKSVRGKGLGRQILNTVIRQSGVQQSGTAKKYLLEVETDNESALALYRSSGFQVKTTYRYYRLQV